MADTGFVICGAGSTLKSATASISWTNPTNIQSADSAVAEVSLQAGDDSDYIVAKNFGFAITTGATITGVQALISVRASNSNRATPSIIQIVKDTTAVTSFTDSNDWTTTTTERTYGSSSNGLSLTPSDVNATTFGFRYCIWDDYTKSVTAYVDYIKMCIYYSTSSIKSVNGLAKASVKVVNGLAIASVKEIDGLL